MSNTTSFFAADHRRCDESWATFEAKATSGDQAGAVKAWEQFLSEMRRHFSMEEEVLFPAFEDATGMHGGGPTAVMRHEHQQMRGLLEEMERAMAQAQLEQVLDHGDTLMMLIQQHNAKEEGILYRMADQVLGPRWAELEKRLDGYR